MEKTSYYLAGEWFAEPYKPVIKQFRGQRPHTAGYHHR